MKHIKLVLLAILVLSAGYAIAADKPAAPANPAPAAPNTSVRITKVSGTVQLVKDGVVFMTIKPGDAIPANLDAGLSFRVVSGSIEVEAGGMKINGVTGSEFKPTFTNGSMVVTSQGSGSVELKSPSGYSVVMPSGSEVKTTSVGTNVNVEVQKGRAVVTDAAGGGTQIVNAGQTVEVPAAAPVVVQGGTPAGTPKEEVKADEGNGENGDNPADSTPYVPESSVITTQEADESAAATDTTATETNEVSGSNP